MYDVELDLALYFEPLMHEDSDGIRFTTRIQLPFVPVVGMHLTGKFLDVYDHVGTEIEDVTWDMDRKLFLADISSRNVDFPFEGIPIFLEDFLRKGWALRQLQ